MIRMARDERVAFKLAEEKKKELEGFADSYGVSTSALCALIIGQWLHQQNNVVNPMVQALTHAMEQQISMMDPNEMVKAMENAKNQQSNG
jgi:hypothetical protein